MSMLSMLLRCCDIHLSQLLLLSVIVGCLEFESLAALVNGQLVCLLQVGILKHVTVHVHVCSFTILTYIDPEMALLGGGQLRIIFIVIVKVPL